MDGSDPLLGTLPKVAVLTGIPLRTCERLASTGRIGPTPIRLGRRKLYRLAEVREWVALGCPGRAEWNARATAGGAQ